MGTDYPVCCVYCHKQFHLRAGKAAVSSFIYYHPKSFLDPLIQGSTNFLSQGPVHGSLCPRLLGRGQTPSLSRFDCYPLGVCRCVSVMGFDISQEDKIERLDGSPFQTSEGLSQERHNKLLFFCSLRPELEDLNVFLMILPKNSMRKNLLLVWTV